MLACGVLTLALAVLLFITTSFPIAVIGLLVLGGPAGVGSSLLFAYLKYSGASPAEGLAIATVDNSFVFLTGFLLWMPLNSRRSRDLCV